MSSLQCECQNTQIVVGTSTMTVDHYHGCLNKVRHFDIHTLNTTVVL